MKNSVWVSFGKNIHLPWECVKHTGGKREMLNLFRVLVKYIRGRKGPHRGWFSCTDKGEVKCETIKF